MAGTLKVEDRQALDHWTRYLASVEPCHFPHLDGELDSPKRLLSVKVDLENLADLRKASSVEAGAALPGQLCVAWGLVLRCYTGSDDVCFGYLETGRDIPAQETAETFVEMPVVRMSIDETASLGELVLKSQAEHARGLRHRQRRLPAETAEAVHLPGRRLFNTAILIRDDSKPVAPDDAIMAVPPLNVTNHEECDIRLHVKLRSGDVGVFLEWWSSAMSAERALDVASTFGQTLRGVVAQPGTSVAELNCFSERNRRQVWAWNSDLPLRIDSRVHDVIHQQAVARPDAAAVCAWDANLTHGELDAASTRLSYRLVELGVGPEVLVPLCFDKSAWNVVAMLGVLKAGGAFVPLDPSHPVARLRALAGKVGATILLCSRRHTSLLASVAGTVLPVDREMLDRLPAYPRGPPPGGATSANAAYLIFTSGTTGEPKGTVVEHGAYCSSAAAHGPATLMRPTSRVLQFAAHTFDASLVESLTPLMLGACVCVPSEEARLGGIAAAINEMGVDWASLTPSFIEFIEPAAVPGLRTLILAGEAMGQSHVVAWAARVSLVNGYGPTECSVSAVINSHVTPETDPKNIGCAVGGRCWLVDPRNHDWLVPVGCVGELLVEGPTLARGYLNDPQRTAECFIEDPAWAPAEDAGAPRRRMYKTGDLARYNADGTLNFVGRKDTQVKFHGQRVELGEIEHHLNADPRVKHGLVLLPRSGYCKQRLVSVLSLSDLPARNPLEEGGALTILDGGSKELADSHVAATREHLSGRLPAYMVPSTWVVVGAIPMLTSGKLDRKRVAKWVEEMSEADYHLITGTTEEDEGSSAKPLTEAESQLRQVWSHVLNLPTDQVGLNRSFLGLGGDSITAMQVMGRCRQQGIGVTVHDILRSKSIADLARCVKTVERPSQHDEVVGEAFDLSPIQQLFFELPDQGQGHFNQSFFLRITRRTQPQDLRRAIEAVIGRHSMLRARFSRSSADGRWQQRVTHEITTSYRFREHRVDAQEQVTPAIADSQISLDATNGPVFAVDLFDVEGGDQLVFMVGHHLVIDLVSWRIILQDVEELLLGLKTSSDKPLPFQTWCRLQAEHCQQLRLSSVLPIENVPVADMAYWGMAGRPNTYGDVATHGFELDAVMTSLVMTRCHDALRTDPVDILLSALIHSFSQVFTDRDVPPIYNEGHGREPWHPTIDLSKTVGWFTAMYPVYVPASAADDLIDTVRKVKDLRRRVPDNGCQYFASRFLTVAGRDQFTRHWPMELAFNYLGKYQQLERDGALLRPVEEMAGEARGAGGTADVGRATPRFALFEISAVIAQGKARFSFTYNRHMRHQDTVRRWIAECQRTLRVAASRLTQMDAEPTLSDFPLLALTYDGLKSLVAETLPRIGVAGLDAVEDVYPCSPVQNGLLLSMTRNAAYYAVRGTYEVTGQVDGRRLTEAWQKVVDRHAALRTVFVESISSGAGFFDQVILKKAQAELVRLECDDDADALSKLDEQRPFGYDGGPRPCHRFTVCQTSAGKVFCKLEISHTIMDGASMSVLFRDLALAYDCRLPKGTGPLYSAYVAYLQSRPPNAAIDYWTSYLANVEPCHFPILNDGVSVARRLHSLRVEFNQFLELQTFCEENGVTLSNLMHTAWGLTLRCYTGSDETCFGYLTSGRDAPIDGVEDAVGPFINMLACRVNMSGTTSLDEVLSRIQSDYVDSLPHMHTSLAEIQHALRLSGTALFNTALSYRKLPPARETERPTISFSECAPQYDPTEYNVSINIEAGDDGAAIDLDYWTDNLSDGQAANVASTFVQSLQNIMHHSKKTIGELDHFSDRNREQVRSWNSEVPETLEECVHRIFEHQAHASPDAAAVCAWDAKFTYAELDNVTTRLAHYLMRFGVGPETLVPICFDKSAWTIVAMLGVLKAGGACVPLDATHPKSGLEMRVRDTQARIVLASPRHADIIEDIVPHVVAVYPALMDRLPAIDGPGSRAVRPTNPCFVIYTSGSTGQPKGVVLEHRAIATSARAHGSVLNIGPHSRVLQFAAYTFDNSLEEMFTTLMRGGCVCVPSDHDRVNNLADVINRLEVNFMDITPTVASFLQPADVPRVKDLVLGGEPLTKPLTETWGKAVCLHSCYGPSECSINCTWNGEVGREGQPTNIGRAIGSVSWVVDPANHDRLTPVGCVGELLVEGPILARGYLNDKQKTAKSFIEDPAWASGMGDAGGRRRRMYKTGDLVRYNADGTIFFVGRKDTQVKLNGQRIELGEIEHHVKASLPANSQSAVELILAGSQGATKTLAAFLCLQSDSCVPASTLGDDWVLPMSETARSVAKSLEVSLTGSLPAYMVPSVYIPVVRMPMTSSGKLDRRRLRSIAQTLSEEQLAMYRLSGKSGRAPSGVMEKKLQRLWEDVLRLDNDSIGADDSFFRLGGDSIAAMRLVTAARMDGILLTVADVFLRSTLSEMAIDATLVGDVVRPEASQRQSQPEPEPEPEPEPFALLQSNMALTPLMEEVTAQCRVGKEAVQDMYPCTPLQEGLIAVSNKQLGAYVAQNIYRISANVDLNRFKEAWRRVVDAEVILRTRIVHTTASGFLQVVVREPITWHIVASLQELPEDDQRLPAYNGGALTRYTIVRRVAGDTHFVWTVHHALYDGWSIPLIFSRVEAAYRNSRSPNLTKGVSYSRFIEYISAADTVASDTFWQSKLSEVSALPFPQLPHPAYQVRATCNLNHTSRVSRGAGTEITMPAMIRAAWAMLLAAYSGSDDVVFGETLTGRDAPVPGIVDMIGPTLATVPMRVRVNRELTVTNFLKEVQAEAAALIPYQHTGLQHIKRLGPDALAASDFQNLLVVNHDSDEDSGDLWELLNNGAVGTKFYSYPLMVECRVGDTKVEIEAHYDPDIITTLQMERLLYQFDSILKRLGLEDGNHERVGDMELLSSLDRETIWSWNADLPKAIDKCIHQVIHRQVLSLPKTTAAVCSWDANFTYRELDELAARLAHHLAGLGVGPQVFVPLCFEKSAWTIVTMLGVMKAGGAFVPLDPSYPVARLQGIVDDVKARLVLCSSQHHKLCESIAYQTFAIDGDSVSRLPLCRNPLPSTASSSVAYAIFTSGTTGKPKGTLVEHTAFCTGAAAHGPGMLMQPTSRVLQFASYTFDASLVEILTTLMLGGCVCIPSEEARLNNIAEAINAMRVTWAVLTPSFVRTIEPSAVPGLRTLVLAGEAMNQSDIATWSGKVDLVNGYGPSECSVAAAVNPRVSLESDPANIGRAVGGRCWIVDARNHNRLAPIGTVGELLVEGPILARGYLNDERKTLDSFVGSPKWARQYEFPGDRREQRMYKTGDLVKYNPDGTMAFVGRKDTQAKLHGQRLELGEVECHLMSDSLVRHALAVIPASGPCEKRLVAILALRGSTAPSPTASGLQLAAREATASYLSGISERLCDRLPAYMIPSKWVVLQEIPLLPSGKLDRRQVVSWVEDMSSDTYRQISDAAAEGQSADAQTTGMERRLQVILAQVLNLPVEQVGLSRSFLHLGGDSISAMQVMSLCRSEDIGVTVEDILRSKTISQLSLSVKLPDWVSYQDEEIDREFDLSPIQQLYFECVGENWSHFNQSVLLRLTRKIQPKDLHSAMEALASSHPMLRARFNKDAAGVWKQRITRDISASYRFQIHDVRSTASDKVRTTVEESQTSLDIQNGPIFAVDLFNVEDDSCRLVALVAHHLVIDVVSWRVILQDLEDFLESDMLKAGSSLPFQTWCRLQVEHTQQDTAKRVLPSDNVPVANLAYWGMAEQPNVYGDVMSDGFEIDANTTRLLLGPCHEALRTEPLDLFVSAITHSFRRVFQDRLSPAVYNEGHGREPWDPKLDLSRTVGWFTTLCPVHSPSLTSPDNDVVNTVRLVKDVRRRIPDMGRQYFTYRLLTPEGREQFAGHWPIEVVFNYLGQQQQFERKEALLQPVDGGQSVNTLSDIGRNVPRFALFEISAIVTQGRVKISFTYNRHMKHRAAIQRWIGDCQKTLKEIIERLVQAKAEPTLSDFPLLPLTYDGLAKMVERLPEIGVSSFDDVEAAYPCSPMQQGLLLSQIRNSAYYTYQAIFQVRSAMAGQRVNAHKLAEAWQEVVRRHAALRTVFIDSLCPKGLIDQVVIKEAVAKIAWLECDDAKVLTVLAEQHPIDFRDAQPPHRLTLCKMPTGRVTCKLEISHVISDGSTMPVILRDLAQAYEGKLSKAERGPLYSDYIAHLQSCDRDADIDYWKTYLAEIEPCHFPFLNDGSKDVKELRSLELPLLQASDLRRFCIENSATVSNVLQLVWALVLRCYTGSDEVCFGYLTSGRDAPVRGIQDAVGVFINMLICRIDLADCVRLDEALDRVQKDFVRSMSHQNYSLAEVQHELQLSGTSLFNTAFSFQNRSGSKDTTQSELMFDVLDTSDPSEYSITVNVEALDSSVIVHFGYWTDSLSAAQASNVASTFDHVLSSIIRRHSEHIAVGELDFFSGHSRRQVRSWNGELPEKVDKCVHEIIEQQVRSQPESAAVCAWDASFTYIELDKLVARLAKRLEGLGVGPEVYVPLCFEKSAWAVVAMLGVLKAGGAFVPLDPSHPSNRLKHIIDSASAKLVLCSARHLKRVRAVADIALVVDRSTVAKLTSHPDTPPSPVPTGANTAYIIFTSGTTGQPKGTVVEHAAFCTGAKAHGKATLLCSTSRVLQFASYTFDASIMEILTTLMFGGCICVPSEQERFNDMTRAINTMAVNWALLTPSVASTIEPVNVPGLQVLVLGGEAMSTGDIVKWTGKAALVNAYGPSECSVVATTSLKLDRSGNQENGDPANIGRAVGGRCWIVDPHNYNRLVPVGSIGELLIEGPIVARGYLNDSQRTAASFIRGPEWIRTDDFGGEMGRKQQMFRSGDLVQYNSDGTLNFVGRKDTQVKLHGQRIELGEIEHHVKLNLPNQSQVAVELVAPAGRGGAKALAAFFCLRVDTSGIADDSALSVSEASTADELLLPMSDAPRYAAKTLESSLAGALPTYMIPSLYFPLAKMPWTSSGKLDRQRLRNIVRSLSEDETALYRLADSTSKRTPSTSMEKKLRRLWETVLNLRPDSVGADDSFFRVGGDSIGAMQLVAAARSEGISLTVVDVFKNPKLSEMASVGGALADDSHSEPEPFALLKGVGSVDRLIDEVAVLCGVSNELVQDIYQCSPLQEGLITLSIKQPMAYVATNVFRLPQGVDIRRFQAAWQKVVGEEIILRTRIVHTRTSGFLEVVVQDQPIVWHTVKNLQAMLNAEQQLSAHNGSPLTRYTIVVEKGSEATYFVWSIHHALYDGWSMPLILRKVESVYSNDPLALSNGTSYASFIKYLLNVDVNASDNFWQSRLSGASPLQFPQLPHTASDEIHNDKVVAHAVGIPRDVTGTDITMPTVIRAAWAVLVAAYAGSDDVIFGETLTGRDIPVPGINEIIGPTLTTVPTRICVDPTISIANFLRAVHEQAVEAIPYQHAGLQYIKRLNPDTSVACDFQNLLVIHPHDVEPSGGLWDLQSNGVGSNFFTYPLVTECKVNDAKVEINVHYDENVISSWQVQRLLYQFESVLGRLYIGLKSDDATLLSELEIFCPQDKEMVWDWNSKKVDVVDECVQHLFEQLALSQPDAPAICSWDGNFTYKETDELATRLAHYLVQLGVGPEVLVPMCFDKSAWAVVATLAVLKAGGAFVPLDPSHPACRHREIVQEIGAWLLLCSPQYTERCSKIVDMPVSVDGERIDQLPTPERPGRLSSRTTSSNAAYVIFTSGSTGKPKGAVVEHGAFCTSSAAFRRGILMKPTSRVFQFASYTFDASVMEVLTTLTFGGCLCVPSEDARINDVAGAINSMNVTWTLLTPSVASIVEPASVPGLEVLMCGGEAMSIENITKWGGRLRLVNAYGPTECSVIATANARVTDPSNIGQTLGGGYAWVVDPLNHNRLAPVGCVGELLIEGPTLARGYLNNEEKTAEVFIENPAWVLAASNQKPIRRRMYKTGDLVRYISDGSLMFVGRKDNQVKLHGQRMELGEIEHHLETNPQIRHALVVMPKSGHCKQRLVAVLSLSDLVPAAAALASTTFEIVEEGPRMETARLQVTQARDQLSNQLPSFMVPATWVVVEAIPLLASGKLDRKQVGRWLENIDEDTYRRIARIGTENDATVPTTVTGKLLQQILSRVLNLPLEKVKVNQSFLSMGGDSITAMQVVARCRKEKINISMHDVLRSKSITQLALCASSEDGSATQAEEVDVLFDLSPIQQLYFESGGDKHRPGRFNQSFSLRLTRETRAYDLNRAIEAIVSQHSMLRARFSKHEYGIWQQRITREVTASYRFRVHHVDATSAIAPAVAASQIHLDIQKGPLFAVDLFNIEGGGQMMFLVAHHLVIDLVSWRVILHDLEELLESGALTANRPLSFQVWCKMQAEHSRQQDASTNGGVLPFKVTPADLGYWGMAGRPNTYGNVDSQTFMLDEATTASALGECHKALRTEPLDLFLSAIAHSFSRVFVDHATPTVFNESHGREPWDSTLDLSRTVGWFTTICPVHFAARSEHKDAVETMRLVRDTRRQIPENGRPYFARRMLTPEVKAQFQDYMPMEIVFNYLGQYQQLESEDALLQQMDFMDEGEDTRLVSDVGQDVSRFALFEISAVVLRGRIQFSFMYNQHMRHQQGIRRWVSECQRTLEETVKRLAHAPAEPEPSDFPLLPITHDGLQEMVKRTLPGVGVSRLDGVEDIYPCSSMQEGLLLSQLRDPGFYAFQFTLEVKPVQAGTQIDGQRLSRAWQKLVNRHPALRTIFVDSVCRDGGFDQVVLKKANSESTWIKYGDSEMQSSVGPEQENDKSKPRLPHQFTVWETSCGKIFCKIEISHAIIDGGSVSVLLHDLAMAYEGRLPSGPGPLYSDYIAFIQSQPPSAHINYWKTYLDGVQPCHFPTLSDGSSREKRLGSIKLDFDRFAELRDVCEKIGVTMSNIMQAAWGLVLRSYTGSDDVCFGYLTSGRDAPVTGIQEAIGAFINMLVCRLKFTRTSPLEGVFQMVQNDYLQSLPFQHCSLAQVHHELDLSGKSLFNTAISIQNHSRSSDSEQSSISFETKAAHDPSEFKVTLNIETSRDNEGVVIRYWTDTLSDSQAENVANLLAQIFRDIVSRPNLTVAELDAVSDRSNQLQGLNWNSVVRKVVHDCVNEIVEQMVKEGEFVRYNSTGIQDLVRRKSAQVKSARQQLNGLRTELERVIPNRTTVADMIKRTPSAYAEKKLLSLWGGLLNMAEDSIGMDDSFFQLGGDSIIAMKLVGAARAEGIFMTVADIFRYPKLADMAGIVQVTSEVNSFQTDTDLNEGQSDSEFTCLRRTTKYQPYSLLKVADIGAFLQSAICPKVHVFRGGIVDVFPVTDFQALAITGALLESKWMLNYFFLDGRGPLNLRLLRQSVLRLVQSYDILRTVFVPHGNRFLQVVLRKLEPEFNVYRTEQDLAEFTAGLQQRDRVQGPRMGESYVQFSVVQREDSDHHRIIIRISHAQYDGVCMPRILGTLQAGYDGLPVPPTPAFSDYVRDTRGGITRDHYDYWETLLKSSSMTSIVHREGPNYNKRSGTTTALKKIIPLSSLASENITPATVVKAAWSLVLAQLSAQSDIVFGHVISGRNADVPEVEGIVGPCLNMVPVRIKFHPTWTVLDLLRQVQNQQVANMPFESLGFREIIKHCTEWPDWTNFSTVLQHQNIEQDSKLQLGEISYSVGAVGSHEDFADLTVLSTPQGTDKIEISLTFSANSTITSPFAEKVLALLCTAVSTFSANPSTALPHPAEFSGMKRQTIKDINKASAHPFSASELAVLDEKQLIVLADLLARAWRQVLHDDSGRKLEPLRLDSSFFDLGGDIIAIAQVASQLEREGYKVSVEDLIDHPVMLDQLALISMGNTREKGQLSRINSAAPSTEQLPVVKERTRGSLWKMGVVLAVKKIRRSSGKAQEER